MFNINFGSLGQAYLNVNAEDTQQKTAPVKVYLNSTIGGKIALLGLKFLSLFSSDYNPIHIKLAKDKQFSNLGISMPEMYITAGSYKRILQNKMINLDLHDHRPVNIKQIKQIAEDVLQVTQQKPRVNLQKGCALAEAKQSHLLHESSKKNVITIINELSKINDPTQRVVEIKFLCSPNGDIVLKPNSDGKTLSEYREEIELEFIQTKNEEAFDEEEIHYNVIFPEKFPHSLNSTFHLLKHVLNTNQESKNESFSAVALTMKNNLWEMDFDSFLSHNTIRFNQDHDVQVNIVGDNISIDANNVTLNSNKFIPMSYPHPILFWNMMAQNESNICVKLASGQRYWPEIEEGQAILEGVAVTCLSVDIDKDGNTRRDFEIQQVGEDGTLGDVKRITHFEYPSWPDYDVPDMDTYEKFVKRVEECHKNTYEGKGAIAVHCQGGRGRTGTFLASYQIMQEPDVDPLTLVKDIRRQRPGRDMVETAEQYIMLNNLKEKYLARKNTSTN